MITISELDIIKHNHHIVYTRSSTYNKHSKAAIYCHFASSIIVKGKIWDFLPSKFKPLLIYVLIIICGQNLVSTFKCTIVSPFHLPDYLLFKKALLYVYVLEQCYYLHIQYFEITWFSKSNNCRVCKYAIVEFCSPRIFTLFN